MKKSSMIYKRIIVFIATLSLLTSALLPFGISAAAANDDMSAQGQALIDAIDSGTVNLGSAEQKVVDLEVSRDAIEEYGFKYAVQQVLNDIKIRNQSEIEEPEEVTTPDEPEVVDEGNQNPEPDEPEVVEEGDQNPEPNDPEVIDEGNQDPEPQEPEEPEVPDEPDEPEEPEPAAEDYTKNADGRYIYRVIIPAGKYESSEYALNVYSNTIIDCRAGVDIYANGCALSGGTSLEGPFSAYDGYKNIVLLGGTYHGVGMGVSTSSHTLKSNASCTIRFGHASNINIVGVKVVDNCGGHHIEVGAVKNLLISDCEFTGYADATGASTGTSLEAIQLDVIHRDEMNFQGYENKDDYAVEDAVIVNNYFHDIRRGVGSHHAVYGHPYKNITISNNSFVNIIDKAIQLEYCTDSTVSNNTITNATCGISYNSAFAGSFYLPNSEDERKALSVNKTINGNTVISGNTITLNTSAVKSDSWADNSKYAIRVFGDNLTASNNKKGYESSTSTLPPNGIYYISNVTVSGNKISTVGGAKSSYLECAIRARYAKSVAIKNNTIDAAAASGVKTGSAINLLDSTSCTVSSNNVKNAYNGISVNGGSGSSVNSNTVSSMLKNGITVIGASVSSVNSNKISATPENAISISEKSTVTNVNSNAISGNFTLGISMSKSSKVSNIASNSISSAKKNGICVTTSSQVTTSISSNTVKSSAANGILIYDNASAKAISKNTISSSKNNAISLSDSASATEISNNTISTSTKAGISLAAKSSVTGKIYKNTIKSSSTHGIMIYDGSKAKAITNNTISSSKSNAISLSKSASATEISSNTINTATKAGISVSTKSSVSSKIYKNTIKSAGTFGILIHDSSSANSINTNNIEKSKKNGICISEKSTCKGFTSNTLKSCGSKNAVSISKNSKGVVLNKNTLTLKVKKTSTLKVTKPNNGKKTTFKTSNKKIATVDSKGKITAKKKGKATITVTNNGVSSKCAVTVK